MSLRNCIICDKEISKGSSKYCSYLCSQIAAKNLSKENILTCINCNIKFINEDIKKQFCSKKCKTQYNKPMFSHKCITCGEQFITKNKKSLFCSAKCEEINEKPFINICINCKNNFRSDKEIKNFYCKDCQKILNKEKRLIKQEVQEKVYNNYIPLYSEGEQSVYQLLTEIFDNCEILYRERYDWLPSPQTGHPLELDFYIPLLNFAIEYDGGQHYDYSEFIHKNKQNFKELQERDNFKNLKCAELGITLIRFDDRFEYVSYTKLMQKIKEAGRADILEKYFYK